MFEHKHDRLLSRVDFAWRLGRSFGVTAVIVAISLLLGAAGYCYFGGLSWVDGLLNAAMILTGMGPVDKMPTAAGKLFSTAYALYSGITFLGVMAVLLAPVFHRLMHSFHLEDEDAESPGTIRIGGSNIYLLSFRRKTRGDDFITAGRGFRKRLLSLTAGELVGA